MSETKYRVWQTNVGDYDKTTKKFTPRPHYFYGNDVVINGNGQLLSVESSWDIQGIEQPTDYVLEQSTGMQDENVKKIYEGDILAIPSRKDKKNNKLYIVVWHKTHARFNFANTNGEFGEISIGKIMRSQIVGNIHENKLENKND